MLKTPYPFDPSLKHHAIIGLLLALWIFVFLFFSEPLDVNQFSFKEKLTYLPGYGMVGGFCYLIFLPFQRFLHKSLYSCWTILNEIVFLLSFCVLAITIARLYYLYIIMANERYPYTLGYMLKTILLPAAATILPIITVARYAFGKYYEKQLNNQKIEIKGSGNYEGLRLHFNDIVGIKSSDNYIEVQYLSGNALKKTLIRNKLSVIDKEFPKLIRTHRSHLINPYHFRQWKTDNGKYILILSHDIKTPVSKTYLQDVKSILDSTTN
ncbi:transcriptional regulator [Winogradskyella sp. J14-2]|nr:transcriptional regulator [Winogradskyella sp. J14-2]